MNDSISRQAAIRIISGYQDGPVDKSVAKRLLTQLPSAQPEIIRCKDCKYYREHDDQDDFCIFRCMQTESNDYCSYAERRTDGE